jgi:RNA polymerase sigma-70 factor (ECF subfamily)
LNATINRHSVFFLSMDDLKTDLSRNLDAAFPRLVEQMNNRLFWGLRRMTGDAQHAEDLSQETMIRAYRALTDYPPSRIRQLKLEPWLWTIALNLGRNHLRDQSRRPTLVEQKSESPSHDDEIPDGAAWENRLRQLSTPQRQAVVLKHVVGLSVAEIAAATGRPEGTCKADISRGLKKLREILEGEDDH